MKLALIQYPLEGYHSLETFFAKISSFIADDAEIHLFPELIAADLLGEATHDLAMLQTGVESPQSQVAREVSQWHKWADLFPEFCNFLKAEARAKNTIIAGGSFPRKEEGKIYNTAVIALPDGELILQPKLFLTQVERQAWGWAAGDKLHYFSWQGYRIVVLICYDIEFPEISMQLCELRPHLILVPSSTASHLGFYRVLWCAQARAIEHFAYVGTVGAVGSIQGTAHFLTNEGQANVLSPSEESYPRSVSSGILNQSQRVLAEIDLEKLEKDRKTVACYPARDQAGRSKVIKRIEV